MADLTVSKKLLKNGNVEVTLTFVAVAKKSAPASASGKMLLGYSSGFKTIDDTEGDKINVVYGWNSGVAQAPKAV
jgi:hypothetical protein